MKTYTVAILLMMTACAAYVPPELSSASDLQIEAIGRIEARQAAIVADYDRELRAAYDAQLKAVFEAELARLTAESGSAVDATKVAALADQREASRLRIAARLDEVRARYSVDVNLAILRRLTESISRWVKTAAEGAANIDALIGEAKEIIGGNPE